MKIYPKIPSRRFNRWVSKRSKNQNIVRAVTAVFILFLAFTALTIATFAWFSKDLPSPYKLTNRQVDQSTQIFDRNGVLLYDIYGNKNRTIVPLNDIPQYLKDATIATEDKNFYTNQGFDPIGILRAVRDIAVNHTLSGGSTLTQQLVKNTLLSNEESLTRKIKELILSVQIEKRYTKDQILQIYFNEIPYGGTAWGVEAGSMQYFGKPVQQLDLLESAILAGLPQSPTFYSPFGSNPTAYKSRTADVLRLMRENGYITPDQEKKALVELKTYQFQGRQDGLLKAPHFVLYVKDLLVQKYGEAVVMSGGLKVTTSLDINLQNSAQQIVSDQVAKEGAAYRYNNADAMVMNPKTGEILAMVGSKDYFAKDFDGQFNVTTAQRQPGSSIKPLNYITGLKKGFTAATLFVDQKTDFPCTGCPGGVYSPVNYDGHYGHGHNGLILMRDALAESLNVPAVKMLDLNGLPDMLQTAHDLGITTLTNPNNYGLSLTLGGGDVKMIDMMSAYSSFANLGLKVSPVSILKVSDSKGNVLEQFNKTPGQRVLDAGVAFIMDNILSDSNAKLPTFGTFGVANLTVPGHTIAAKTGTTDDIRDNWTFGYTPSYVVATWVGNNDNSPISGRLSSGLTGAAPIWKKIMSQVLTMYKVGEETWQPPDNVIQAQIDAYYGTKPVAGDPTKMEWFTKSTVPGNSANVQTLRICSDQKKLATPADEAAGTAIDQTFVKVGDSFSPGQWVPYDPPTEKCNVARSTSGPIQTNVTSGNIGPSPFTITATAVGPNPITQVQFIIDSNQMACTVTTAPYSCTVSLKKGDHTVTVNATDNQGGQGTVTVQITVSD